MRFFAIGGYNEVGKNMSAVEVNGEVVICDMGVQVDKLIEIEGGGDEYRKTSTHKLVQLGVLPDDKVLHGKKVVAIVIGHAHLDHCDAVPRLAERYRCPIIGTPYTCEVIKRVVRDEDVPHIRKHVQPLNAGEVAVLSRNFEVELVNMTHSIPQSALVALHTSEGTVVYLNDYKLDNTPTLGEKPDYKRIKELGKNGVKILVIESVRAGEPGHTPSEMVAKVMVKDTLRKAYEQRRGLVVASTFASHIARLKAIIESNKGERKIAMLGRSLMEYVEPAREMRLLETDEIVIMAKKRRGVAAALEKISRSKDDWLVITTGHQGEPKAVLSRMARQEHAFKFGKDDQVIFSSDVVPVPINMANRSELQRLLKNQGVRIFDGVHVSGHAKREDDRDMIRMLQPEMIFPSHGDKEKLLALASLAEEEGYKIGHTVRVLHNGAIVDR